MMNSSRHVASTAWAPWQSLIPVTAREFVAASEKLLVAAVDATVAASGLPAAQVRRLLIDGLAQSLSTDGPLAVVRIDTRAQHGGARHALQESAQRVSRYLLDLLEDHPAETRRHPVDEGFVSHCVGYVWTPTVAAMLTGIAGTHVARNHYNEWLWQMVSLRDALIPFARPEEIRVVVDSEGLRRIEPARDRFTFELTSRRVSFATLFALVAAVLDGSEPVPAGAYGVRTSAGLVLPAMVIQQDVDASPWQFDVTDGSPFATTGYVIPAAPSGTTAQASELLDMPPAPDPGPVGFRLVAEGDALILACLPGEHLRRVDVAAIVAGHRRALRPTGPGPAHPRAVNVAPTDNGLSVISTRGDWTLIAAALGTLEPGHAVLWRGEAASAFATATESGGGPVLVDLRVRG